MSYDPLRIALATVPQWYEAATGPVAVTASTTSQRAVRFSHRPPTPALKELLGFIESQADSWRPGNAGASQQLHSELVQEAVVLSWLSTSIPGTDWPRLLDFLRRLRTQTYEGAPISLNLRVSDGVGTADLTDPVHEKYLSPLASSPQVFLRVNRSLQVVSYEEIPWGVIQDTSEYKFHPEFLHPFVAQLKSSEASVHLTAASDIVILDHEGLLAACRGSRWFIYDVRTLKNSLADILGEYRLGCNLFELLFDLSYRRRGALLIYDPDAKVRAHIVNPQSRIAGKEAGVPPGSLQEAVGEAVYGISMSHAGYATRKKRLLLEVASLDGAVVFSKAGIFALGAFIEPHPEVGSHFGARTTAAASAYRWGGTPMKVSTDGDISIYFQSKGSGSGCDGRLDFR